MIGFNTFKRQLFPANAYENSRNIFQRPIYWDNLNNRRKVLYVIKYFLKVYMLYPVRWIAYKFYKLRYWLGKRRWYYFGAGFSVPNYPVNRSGLWAKYRLDYDYLGRFALMRREPHPEAERHGPWIKETIIIKFRMRVYA